MVIKKILKITILGSEYCRDSEIRKSMLIRQRPDRKKEENQENKDKGNNRRLLVELSDLICCS